MPVQYVKMKKDGEIQKIESDRVERFQELGWAKLEDKKSLSRNKITASAEVTSIKDEEDWDPSQGDWADSQESEIQELPNDEEN